MYPADCGAAYPARSRGVRAVATGLVGASILLAAQAATAAIEINRAEISATAYAKVTEYIPNPPYFSTLDYTDAEYEIARAPLFVPESRGTSDPLDPYAPGDFTAQADLIVPRSFGTGQPYVAAQQNITSNAVAARTYYTDALSIELRALTSWAVSISNSGPAPLPVDFSFYISGGGLDLYCTVCPFGAITASIFASIAVTGGSGNDVPWTYSVSLIGQAVGDATLNTTGTGSVVTPTPTTPEDQARFATHDDLGIGHPTATLITGPSVSPYTVVEISDFNGVANLGMLDPGATMLIGYTLGAAVAGVNSAYASAWLVDPFSLGSPPPGLPSAQFALNGVPINFSAVPLPASGWLVLASCVLLRRRRALIRPLPAAVRTPAARCPADRR